MPGFMEVMILKTQSSATSLPVHPFPVRLPGDIARPQWTQHCTTLAVPFDDDTLPRRLDALLSGAGTILHIDLFGGPSQMAAMRGELQRRAIAAPQTAILSGSELHGGLQIGVLEGIPATPVIHAGRIIGHTFEDDDAKYCLLGDIRPADTAAPREQQAGEVFQTIADALAGAGMDFTHVVRTWFYNLRILDWYDAFNRVRTAFFRRHAITRMPASTGVGAANPFGTALVAKALAVLPKTDAVTIRAIDSPLQCDAFAYGSAFSRALEIATPRARTLHVSGTASIEPGGKTLHPGDTARQISTTMHVVDALLLHAGMNLADTTRAIAYFRHGSDMHLWDEYRRSRALPPLPVIVTQCDICRDDLLFEIELDAGRA
jgi:enamine deaminase RidA (YjgF/YER057c/UK114 family)